MAKRVSLNKAIQEFGGQNIELKAGFHYSYGFFEKDGQLYYINSGDDRMRRSDGQLDVMYRTAQHRKDWTGGTNRWDFIPTLNNKGFFVATCRVKN